VSEQGLRTLLRLLDAMDDHFDQKISDHEFLTQAASARDILKPSPVDDPLLVTAARALEDFLTAARGDPLPAEPYGNLRSALAELEELR
jgi:hypothetical protein